MSANFFSVLDDLTEDNNVKKQAAKPKAPAAKATTPAAKAPAKGAAKPTTAAKPAAAKPKPTVLAPSPVQSNKPPRQQRADAHTGPRRQTKELTPEGAQPPRKRQFDRHSGTGRGGGPKTGKEVKKGGSGGSNWGSVEDEIKEGTQEVAQQTGAPAEQHANPQGEGEKKEGAAPATTEGQTPAAVSHHKDEKKEEEEEEDKGITLKEYRKTQKKKAVAMTAAPRRANEGEDPKQQANLQTYKREDEVFLVTKEADAKKAATPAPAAATKQEVSKKDAKKAAKKAETAAPAQPAAAKEKAVPTEKFFNVRLGEEKRGGRGRGGEHRGGRPHHQQRSAQGSFDAKESSFPALATKS